MGNKNKMNKDILFIWQLQKYGNCKRFPTTFLLRVNLTLSFIIVGLYPVPIAYMINKIIKRYIGKEIKYRY